MDTLSVCFVSVYKQRFSMAQQVADHITFFVDTRDNTTYFPSRRCRFVVREKQFIFQVDNEVMQYTGQEIENRYDNHQAFYLCSIVLRDTTGLQAPTETLFTMRQNQWTLINNWLMQTCNSKPDLQIAQISPTEEIKIWSFLELTDGSVSSDNTEALVSIKSFHPYLVQLT